MRETITLLAIYSVSDVRRLRALLTVVREDVNPVVVVVA